jgi:SAM-dependent methyltransferase
MQRARAFFKFISLLRVVIIKSRNNFDLQMSLRQHEQDHLLTRAKLKDLQKNPALALDHDVRIIGDERYRENQLAVMSPELRKIVSKKEYLKGNALEIGSGAGWLSHLISPYFRQVFSIEPSESGHTLAKQYFGQAKNINFLNVDITGLRNLQQIPNFQFFMTCFVLSHLNNKEVKVISEYISSVGSIGSEALLIERWSTNRVTGRMWHIRTPDEWRKLFPNHDLYFHKNVEFEETFVGIHLIRRPEQKTRDNISLHS